MMGAGKFASLMSLLALGVVGTLWISAQQRQISPASESKPHVWSVPGGALIGEAPTSRFIPSEYGPFELSTMYKGARSYPEGLAAHKAALLVQQQQQQQQRPSWKVASTTSGDDEEDNYHQMADYFRVDQGWVVDRNTDGSIRTGPWTPSVAPPLTLNGKPASLLPPREGTNDPAYRNVRCPRLRFWKYNDPSGTYNVTCHYHRAVKPLLLLVKYNPAAGNIIVSVADNQCDVLLCSSTRGDGGTYRVYNLDAPDRPVEWSDLMMTMSAIKPWMNQAFVWLESMGLINVSLPISHYMGSDFGRDRSGAATGAGDYPVEWYFRYLACFTSLARRMTNLTSSERLGGGAAAVATMKETVWSAAPASNNRSQYTDPADWAEYVADESSLCVPGDVHKTSYMEMSGGELSEYEFQAVLSRAVSDTSSPVPASPLPLLTEFLSGEWWGALMTRVIYRPGRWIAPGTDGPYEVHFGVSQDDAVTRDRMICTGIESWHNPAGATSPEQLEYQNCILSAYVPDELYGYNYIFDPTVNDFIAGPKPLETPHASASCIESQLRPWGNGGLPAYCAYGLTDVKIVAGSVWMTAMAGHAHGLLTTAKGGVPGTQVRILSSDVVDQWIAYSSDGSDPDGVLREYNRAYSYGLGYKPPTGDPTGRVGYVEFLSSEAVIGQGSYGWEQLCDPVKKLTLTNSPQYPVDARTNGTDHFLTPVTEDLGRALVYLLENTNLPQLVDNPSQFDAYERGNRVRQTTPVYDDLSSLGSWSELFPGVPVPVWFPSTGSR